MISEVKKAMLKYLMDKHWANGRDLDIIAGFIEDFFSNTEGEFGCLPNVRFLNVPDLDFRRDWKCFKDHLPNCNSKIWIKDSSLAGHAFTRFLGLILDEKLPIIRTSNGHVKPISITHEWCYHKDVLDLQEELPPVQSKKKTAEES